MSQPLYIANFIPKDEADAAFERIWHTLDWERRSDAPRREYWQNHINMPYTYGKGAGVRTYEPRPWDESALDWMNRLNDIFAYRLDCCFMNGYENSRDWLGWHSDNSPELDDDQPIISLSLGGERDIEIRKMGEKETQRFLLGHGSVFIMPPGMQDTHEHRIPKVGHDVPPRISFTYRRLITEPRLT